MNIDWDRLISFATNVAALLMAGAAWLSSHNTARRVNSENRKDDAEGEKAKAEATEQVTQAALALIKPLEERIVQLEKERQADQDTKAALQAKVGLLQDEMREVRYTNAQLLAGVNRLSHQVRALGHEPVFDPQRDLQVLPMLAPKPDGEKSA